MTVRAAFRRFVALDERDVPHLLQRMSNQALRRMASATEFGRG